MLALVKKTIHRSFRALGLDVRSIGKLDAALDERDKARQAAYHRRLAALKKQRDEKAAATFQPAPVPGAGGAAITWVSAADLEATASGRLRDAGVVLDVGCAYRPQKLLEARTHICCEPFSDYLHRLMVETGDDKKYVYLQADLADVSHLFPPRSVDTVFLLEVIEHMERQVGVDSLPALMRIARSQVVVSTPLGFMPQEGQTEHGDQWGMEGGHWQEHKSGWEPSDFPAHDGWEVIACRDFHRRDAYGRDFAEPIGAMWAIWTAPAGTAVG